MRPFSAGHRPGVFFRRNGYERASTSAGCRSITLHFSARKQPAREAFAKRVITPLLTPRRKTRVRRLLDAREQRDPLLVPRGKTQLPPKPQFSRMVVRDSNPRMFSQMAANRIGYRIGCGNAVQLIVGNAYDRPPHGSEGVRSAGIAYAMRLAFVGFPALVFHVELRFRPA